MISDVNALIETVRRGLIVRLPGERMAWEFPKSEEVAAALEEEWEKYEGSVHFILLGKDKRIEELEAKLA